MKQSFGLFDLTKKIDYKIEILAGLTVALALIPEAVAFSLIAGLSPLTGLYAAFSMGFITSAFNEKFDVLNDPDEVIIDFQDSRVADMSGIEALNKITERYHKAGKKIHLKHLSPDCRRLLKNAESIIDVNIIEDPIYHVAVDKPA